jgi:dTDP-4-dehydrorhamnose reductase
VNDQIGRPTYSRDLAHWTWQLVERGVDGIIHAANTGTATWFDVAARVFARAGVPELLTSCTSADYPTPAKRPSYSALDTTKLEHEIGPLRAWVDALDEFLDEIGTGKTQ